MEDADEELIMKTIDREFKKYLSSPGNLESSANSVVDDLIDDAILSVVFELDIARKAKIGETLLGENENELFQIMDSDVFGSSGKKSSLCVCPQCNMSVGFDGFAPHLARCMGLGRSSSRTARNRIANYANKEIGDVSDDEGASDWTEKVTESKSKKKREKVASKKLKTSKSTKNGNSSQISYENMSDRDRRALLTQICGVISDQSRKVCTKSTKCSQHSEEEKKAIRTMTLADIDTFIDNLQIDVEDDTESGKNSITRSWEAEHSNTSSPADSASTSSSSSKKREKASFKSKSKSQSSKHSRTSGK